jgi:hypothetical protein
MLASVLSLPSYSRFGQYTAAARMVKSKVIRLDPQDIKRLVDVGGPSALNTTLKNSKSLLKIHLIKIN